MKIRILRDFETRDPKTQWAVGEATVQRSIGQAFIASGLAVEVVPDDPVIPDGVEDAESSELGD